MSRTLYVLGARTRLDRLLGLMGLEALGLRRTGAASFEPVLFLFHTRYGSVVLPEPDRQSGVPLGADLRDKGKIAPDTPFHLG